MEQGGGVRFAALAETIDGYGGRGVDGEAFKSLDGYLFKDSDGDAWWIVFQPTSEASSHGPGVRGDVLACSAGQEEVVSVLVLAEDVLRKDTDAAFQTKRPSSYEDAAAVAASIPGRREE